MLLTLLFFLSAILKVMSLTLEEIIQCNLVPPACDPGSDCESCICIEKYKKYQLENGKYACNGDKCATYITTGTFIQVKQCTSCVLGYQLNVSKFCILSSTSDSNNPSSSNGCQQSQYLENNSCFDCIENCYLCSNNTSCGLCKEGYYFDNIHCVECSQNCLKCYGQAQQCTECSSERELTASNTCICKTGYYEQNSQCIECQLPCIRCTSTYVCQECQPNSLIYLNSDQACFCQEGYYYQNINQNCELCDLTCKTCTSTSNNCLSCYVQQNRILENNQCVCQDNYFENSMKQCISCQSPEALTIEKCNYANCQDGLWSYGEQCDDGNYQTKDGCNNCQIEQSFYCINQISQPSQCFRCPDNCINCLYQNNKVLCTNVIDGYFINDLNIQKCNEKCLNCYNQASNCLGCKYLNIKNSSINCQFCEYKQGYYTNFENNMCYTKCGDGLVADVEQCDDGNLQNGDGCDNQCQLEKQYNCQNHICMKQDVPYPIGQSNNTFSLFNPVRQAIVSYKQLLNLSEYFNISDHINVQIIDKDFNKMSSTINIFQNLQWDSQHGSNLSFIVDCHFNESYENIQMQIKYSEPIEIRNLQNIFQEVNLFQIKLDDVRFITSNIEIITDKAITSTNYLLYYLLGLLFCALLFGGLEIYYNLLDTIQAFSYLYYINIQFPFNLEQFFQNLNFAQFTFLQDFFNLQQFYSNLFNINIGNIQKNFNLPQKVQNQGYSSFFIINFASIFCVFAISILIYIFAKVHYKYFLNEIIRQNILSFDNKYARIFKKFKAFIKKYVRNQAKTIQAEYLYSGILRIFMASASEFSFSLQIGIKGFSLQNSIEILNSFTMLIFILFYILTTFFSIFIIDQKTYQVKNKRFQLRFGSLFEGLAVKKYSFIINPIMIVKKFFFMFILIQLYDYSIYQIYHILLLSIFYLTYLVLFTPFEESLELKKNILCECQQTVSLLFFLILSINEQLAFLNYNQQLFVGWLIISSIVIALATQVVIDSIQQFKLMYYKNKIFKKICNSLTNAITKDKNKATPHLFTE